MKNKMKACIFFLAAFLCFFGISLPVKAENLDEILQYDITADVNDDATVNLRYHVVWKVLDSDSEGPLEWVKIGLPNSHVTDVKSLSDTISDIEIDEDGGTYANVTFTDSYEADEVVTFDFSIKQDYLYQMNQKEEGTTTYTFTPGWFDSIVVDNMTIRWKADKAGSWSPECTVKDGYNTWTTSLAEGENYTITMTYPTDAFAFNAEVSDGYEETTYDDYSYEDEDNDFGYDDVYYDDGGDGAGVFIVVFVWVILVIVFAMSSSIINYNRGSGFGQKTETKITRTKIVYHTNCPNCGAPREEGKEVCQYCKTNLVKSEEIIKEETLTKEERDDLNKNYRKDGEYAYSAIPNTFIRVHTVHIPVPPSNPGSRSGRSGRGGGGCAHGSCACASSCACACACACAGGGRAGCSNKDFYKGVRLPKKKKDH